MRPQFEFAFPIEPDAALQLLKGVMDNNDHPIEGRAAGNHLMLVIPIKDRHFWSPWLNIEALDHEPDSPSTHPQTKIVGRFSPNPSVWTAFMLVYSSLAVLAFLAAMFAVSQLIMGNAPWAFQFLIPIFLIAGAMYWASLIGQKIAHDQMQLLYRVTLETLAQGSGLQAITPLSSSSPTHPTTLPTDQPVPAGSEPQSQP